MRSWWRSSPSVSPSPTRSAASLDRILGERGVKLNAVIELKVDEGILIKRIETRVTQMTARGERLRSDDNAEVLKGRLAAYRELTAPLVDYYAASGLLRSVDGMAPIDAVTAAINRILRSVGKAKPARRKARAGKVLKAPQPRSDAGPSARKGTNLGSN